MFIFVCAGSSLLEGPFSLLAESGLLLAVDFFSAELWEPWLSQHSQKVNAWPEANYRPGMAAQVTRDGYQCRGTTHSPLWNLLLLKCPMKYMATRNHVDLEMELFFSLGCNTICFNQTHTNKI